MNLTWWGNQGDKTSLFYRIESIIETTHAADRLWFLGIDSCASVHRHYLFTPKPNDFLHSITAFFLFCLDNTVGRVDKLFSVPAPDWQPNGFIDPPETLCDTYRWLQTWRMAPLQQPCDSPAVNALKTRPATRSLQGHRARRRSSDRCVLCI